MFLGKIQKSYPQLSVRLCLIVRIEVFRPAKETQEPRLQLNSTQRPDLLHLFHWVKIELEETSAKREWWPKVSNLATYFPISASGISLTESSASYSRWVILIRTVSPTITLRGSEGKLSSTAADTAWVMTLVPAAPSQVTRETTKNK